MVTALHRSTKLAQSSVDWGHSLVILVQNSVPCLFKVTQTGTHRVAIRPCQGRRIECVARSPLAHSGAGRVAGGITYTCTCKFNTQGPWERIAISSNSKSHWYSMGLSLVRIVQMGVTVHESMRYRRCTAAAAIHGSAGARLRRCLMGQWRAPSRFHCWSTCSTCSAAAQR